MALSPEFAQKLQNAGNDTKALTALMAAIDEDKRALKSALSQLSSEPEGKFGRGRARQVMIRKMKDKQSFLTEEREVVRLKLGRLKMDKKALNRALSSRSPEFTHAFVASAERLLPEELFQDLEVRAAEMLLAENGERRS